ncbi:MAG TPA: metallophosphoesterase [Stellaceae bacterium]|nr:metallophosphoesterase [Stellaceae bacterium]
MAERKSDRETGTPSRRRLLQCMAAAGAGTLWTMVGGVPQAFRLGGEALAAAPGGFSFVQLSDTHIGFHGEANPDPAGTLSAAVQRIAALPQKPAFIMHTGDVSHLSKPEEFDAAEQLMSGARLKVHYIPGEHDTLIDDGKPFFARFAKGVKTGGWYSFDQGGVHFVALINVVGLKPGGQGKLGDEQIEWLEKDLKGKSASTPIVVFAHMPLWPAYPEWGWGTDDAADALAYLKRFGSVTVLNGHIHQVLQKVEGNVTFHTALSTAYPQPAPGEGKGPGPLKVPPDQLRSMLGVRAIAYGAGGKSPVLADRTLA